MANEEAGGVFELIVADTGVDYGDLPIGENLGGDFSESQGSGSLRVVHGAYAPNRALIGLDPAESTPFASPILDGRMQVGAAPTAYVCRNYACDLPTTDPSVLAAQLTSPNAS